MTPLPEREPSRLTEENTARAKAIADEVRTGVIAVEDGLRGIVHILATQVLSEMITPLVNVLFTGDTKRQHDAAEEYHRRAFEETLGRLDRPRQEAEAARIALHKRQPWLRLQEGYEAQKGKRKGRPRKGKTKR